MSNVDALQRAARAASRARFAVAHAGFFLAAYAHDSEAIAFASRWESVGSRAAPAAQLVDAFAIEKSERDPYAGRISIGRASDCDLVLRHASVSKLHAHFRTGPRGALELVDLGSKNGTKLNARPLAPSASYPVAADDVVRFGSVPARLVDAASLFDLLRA